MLTGTPIGDRRAVAVVVAKFNGDVTRRMLETALAELERTGVAPEAVTIVPVPGAFELPLAAMALAKTRKYACIVALGCVIRGETPHFDFVAGEAASGLQLAGIETGVPIGFGVLTTETFEQAEARIDRAADAVRTALEMADVFQQVRHSGSLDCAAECPGFAQSVGRSRASVTTGATRWWPRSGASTPTSSGCASSSRGSRPARTSAPGA